MKAKIIVALDVDSYERATQLVEQLDDAVEIFKVGSQLFTRVGPKIVEFLHQHDKKVFLDLKFHDIPNTVAKAVESASSLGVFMLTLHTSGGEEMLRAAAAVPNRPLLLGVTVLTSVAGNVTDEVVRRAKLARECGLAGVIASPHEIAPVRQSVGREFIIVTPGIRPAGGDVGDQKRVMTPGEAAKAGADFLVIGRPIIAAENPVLATLKIAAELNA